MSIIYQGEEWLTLSEAADYIGTSADVVLAATQEGKLDVARVNGRLYVPLRGATSYAVRSTPSDFFDGLWELLQLLLRGRRRR
jgi:excisionase family DNA binding protein